MFRFEGTHFFPLNKFPDFSSISDIFPHFFPGSTAQIIKYLYFKWAYNVKLNLQIKLN